jgi:peptidyl-prolyl cis-trans isomerase B (cyclophilin B)
MVVLCVLWGGIISATGCGNVSPPNPSTASIPKSGGETKSTPTADAGPKTPQSNGDPNHPEILLETSLGNVTLRLDGEKAPLSMQNFLYYVEAGLYDQTIFHQVYKDQGILAGGYTTSLTAIPANHPIYNEARNGLQNKRGTLAMIREPDVSDSATSQFFINVADNSALDYRESTPAGYGYCVFGEVIAGMDVVDKIAAVEVKNSEKFDRTPVQAVVIRSARKVK